MFFYFLVSMPLNLALNVYILWARIGPCCLIAFGIIFLFYFVQQWIANINKKNF